MGSGGSFAPSLSRSPRPPWHVSPNRGSLCGVALQVDQRPHLQVPSPSQAETPTQEVDLDTKTLEIERVPLDSLHPDPANTRAHDERNLEAIQGSLARFHQQKPIVVDHDGVIRAGNGTYEAAKALGWETIDVVRTDLEGPPELFARPMRKHTRPGDVVFEPFCGSGSQLIAAEELG